MQIEQVLMYRYNGALYSSEQAAQGAVENRLGAIVDRMDAACGAPLGPKAKLAILRFLLENRAEVIDTLDF